MNVDKVKALADQMMNEEDVMKRTHMAMGISHLLDMEGTERGCFLFIPYMKDCDPDIDNNIWELHSYHEYAYSVYIKKSIFYETYNLVEE